MEKQLEHTSYYSADVEELYLQLRTALDEAAEIGRNILVVSPRDTERHGRIMFLQTEFLERFDPKDRLSVAGHILGPDYGNAFFPRVVPFQGEWAFYDEPNVVPGSFLSWNQQLRQTLPWRWFYIKPESSLEDIVRDYQAACAYRPRRKITFTTLIPEDTKGC